MQRQMNFLTVEGLKVFASKIRVVRREVFTVLPSLPFAPSTRQNINKLRSIAPLINKGSNNAAS